MFLRKAKKTKISGMKLFSLVIFGSIVVALMMVSWSMYLYYSTGAVDTDLSLPRYRAERENLNSEIINDGFSRSGQINKEEMDKFFLMYNEELQNAKDAGSFSPEALSDSALGIEVRGE